MLLLPLKNNAFAIFDFPSPIPEIHRTNRFLLNERSSTGTSERATRNLLGIVIGPCAYQSAAIEQQKRHTSDSSWVKAAVLHRLSSDGRRSFAVIQRELCFWGTGRDASMAALKLYSRRQWGDRCSNIRLYVSWRVIVFSFSLYLSLFPSLITERREYDDDDNDFGPRCMTAPRSFLRVMANDFVGNIAKGEIRRPRNLSTWVWYNMHRARILVISSNRVFRQI